MGAAWADDRLPDRRNGPDLTIAEVTDPRLLELVPTVDLDGPTSVPVRGRVAQVHRAAAPPSAGMGAIEEWFITDSEGNTLVLAVPIVDSATAAVGSPGARVSGRGVLVGTLSAVGRDGARRSWPLYLGRLDPLTGAPWSGGVASVVAATVLAAGGWLLLRRRLARSVRTPSIGGKREVLDGPDAVSGPELPSDPADAMAMLADLAEEGDSGPSDPKAVERSDR